MEPLRDRLRLPDADALLLALTVVIKIGVLAIGAAAYAMATGRLDAIGALETWNRWDAPHYLDLVVFGYRAVDDGTLIGPDGYRSVYPGDLPLYIVFYPLFPWLATAVNAVVGDPLVSAFVVSSVASLFVAPLMYRLVREDEDVGVALRAAWFLLIFPTAYFLHIGYTESLFMALVLGSFLAGRTRHWWIAGLLGGLAALTRINGLVLLPALAAEAFTQWYEQPRGQRRLRMEWLAIGLVGVGFLAYIGLNLAIYGEPFTFLRVQREHWFKELAPPWEAISAAVGWLRSDDPDTVFIHGSMELAFVVIGLLAVLISAFRLRPSYFAWTAGNWLLFTSTSFLLSMPRYTLTLFPVMVLLALPTRRVWLLAALSAVSLAAFVYFAIRFATGSWAF
ncbi:MAG TPA: glycosyltransferase family 39 protein [Candidatus Limnocylindria bacterium]|nr:glycosyltransferase family 39 protein [Candidatus Limnocylindria bacterium]